MLPPIKPPSTWTIHYYQEGGEIEAMKDVINEEYPKTDYPSVKVIAVESVSQFIQIMHYMQM